MRTIPLLFAAAGVAASALEATAARRRPGAAMLVWGAIGYGVGTLFDKTSSSAAVVVADDTILRVPAGLRV